MFLKREGWYRTMWQINSPFAEGVRRISFFARLTEHCPTSASLRLKWKCDVTYSTVFDACYIFSLPDFSVRNCFTPGSSPVSGSLLYFGLRIQLEVSCQSIVLCCPNFWTDNATLFFFRQQICDVSSQCPSGYSYFRSLDFQWSIVCSRHLPSRKCFKCLVHYPRGMNFVKLKSWIGIAINWALL